MGSKDDDEENSTICSVNTGTSGQVECKGTINVIPQERQLKEQKQRVKREHDTKITEVEKYPLTNGDIYENQMDNHESPQHLQHQRQEQQQQTQACLQATRMHIEKVGTQTLVVVFKPQELHVLVKLGSTKGKSFKFGLGSRLVQELGSFAKGSKNPMT